MQGTGRYRIIAARNAPKKRITSALIGRIGDAKSVPALLANGPCKHYRDPGWQVIYGCPDARCFSALSLVTFILSLLPVLALTTRCHHPPLHLQLSPSRLCHTAPSFRLHASAAREQRGEGQLITSQDPERWDCDARPRLQMEFPDQGRHLGVPDPTMPPGNRKGTTLIP
jgi:hypothetical protein